MNTSTPMDCCWDAMNALDTRHVGGPIDIQQLFAAVTCEAIHDLDSEADHMNFPTKTEPIKVWPPTKAVNLSQVLG